MLAGRSRERVTAGQARANELLERNRNRPVIDVLLRVYYRDRESAGTVVGSAIAFRLFLFIVPLLLFGVGVLGFVGSRVAARDVNDAAGLEGGLAAQMASAMNQPDSTRWLAILVGLVGMATTGRSLSKVLVSASCLAWQLPVRTKASPRVVGAIIGVVAGIGLISLLVNRAREALGVGGASISFLAAFALYIPLWMLLQAMLPRGTNDPGAVLPGGALLATVVVAMQAISQLYLPDRFSRASDLYGAIGTTIVTLGWFFFLGRAIVLAMSVDAVIHERFGSITRFVFALPVLRLLPRHSKLVRRIFDLDRPERVEP